MQGDHQNRLLQWNYNKVTSEPLVEVEIELVK